MLKELSRVADNTDKMKDLLVDIKTLLVNVVNLLEAQNKKLAEKPAKRNGTA